MSHVLNSLVTIFSTIIGVIVAESLLTYFCETENSISSNIETED